MSNRGLWFMQTQPDSNNSFKKALECQVNGNTPKALRLYAQCLEQGHDSEQLYLNYGSLLRSLDSAAALSLYLKAIKLYPESPGLHNNLANVLTDQSQHHKAAFHYYCALALSPSLLDSRLSLSRYYLKNNHINTAFHLLLSGFKYIKQDEFVRLLNPTAELLLHPSLSPDNYPLNDLISLVESSLELSLSDNSNDSTHNISMILTLLNANKGNIDIALKYHLASLHHLRTKLESVNSKLKPGFRETWYNFNWNLSIKLLTYGRFHEGWCLYDYGLAVKAKGPQKWQRALCKPFTSQQIPLWKGQSLTGKTILLLGEQGIGDSMMFFSQGLKLSTEAKHITFVLEDRLASIYDTSAYLNVSILGINSITSIEPSNYDYMCPLGSIFQYRYLHINDYGLPAKLLKQEDDVISILKSQYNYDKKKFLVGLSWQGGGTPQRINDKSIPLKLLYQYLGKVNPNIRFVSLQYSIKPDHYPKLSSWFPGLLYDSDICARKGFAKWIQQVYAMDCIITIANTTLHAAAQAYKPTLCLLGSNPDWRWISNGITSGDVGCHWYNDVDVLYRDQSDWSNVLQKATHWLQEKLNHWEEF